MVTWSVGVLRCPIALAGDGRREAETAPCAPWPGGRGSESGGEISHGRESRVGSAPQPAGRIEH